MITKGSAEALGKKQTQYPFVLCNHKLGICFDAIPSLYKFVAGEFAKRRTQDNYDMDVLHRHTRALLLINAENYTAWNARWGTPFLHNSSLSQEIPPPVV